MPFRRKSSSNPKPAPAVLLPLLAAAFVLGGCLAMDESRPYVDQPLGQNYLPVITRRIDLWPNRLLILPVSGNVSDSARAQFEQAFLAEFRQRVPWVLLSYDGVGSTGSSLRITEGDAVNRAKQLDADAILHVELSDQRIYPPFELVAHVRIEDISSRTPALELTADYNAGNKDVATSARRYYYRDGGDRSQPDKSLSIFNNVDQYLQFTGYYTARLVGNSFTTPNKRVKKGEPVPPPDQTTAEPAPAFQPAPSSQGNTDK